MVAALMNVIKQKHVKNKSMKVKRQSKESEQAKLLPQLLRLTTKLTYMVKKQLSKTTPKKKRTVKKSKTTKRRS